MARFEQEKAHVEELLSRLRLTASTPIINPNRPREPDSGVDCVFDLADGRRIGVQVTELDPWPAPGSRGDEAALAKARYYGMFAQNEPAVLLEAIRRAIAGKVEIAARHNFEWLNEVWLLVCAGAPEHPASTFVATGWLRADEIQEQTKTLLHVSKYDYCFLLVVLGVEKSLYRRHRRRRWEKLVELADITQQPSGRYVTDLVAAFSAADMEEFDRLTQEEVEQALREVRNK